MCGFGSGGGEAAGGSLCARWCCSVLYAGTEEDRLEEAKTVRPSCEGKERNWRRHKEKLEPENG